MKQIESSKTLTAAEASKLLKVAVNTLYQWRHLDRGPESTKLRGHVRYRLEDVERFMEECKIGRRHVLRLYDHAQRGSR